MEISRLDHFVLTTAHPEECLRFYTEILGMELRRENDRCAIRTATSSSFAAMEKNSRMPRRNSRHKIF